MRRREGAATIIQAVYRCERDKANLLRHKCAAAGIQRWFRSIRDRSKYCRLLRSVVQLQASARTILAKRYALTLFKLQRAKVVAALKVQSLFRASHRRAVYHQYVQAAITIQKRSRMHRARLKILPIQRMVPCINESTKPHASVCSIGKVRTRHGGEAILEEASVTKLQALCREHLNRVKYLCFRQAIVRLQSIHRGIHVRRVLSRKKDISLRYMTHPPPRREQLAPDQLGVRRQKIGARKGWDSSKGMSVELTRKSKSDAVLQLQRSFRSHLELSEQEQRRYRIVSVRDHTAATTIQTLARVYLARKYLTGLQQPFIQWNAHHFDTSQDRSLFDNDSGSEGTDRNHLEPDCALERRALLSIVGAFGALSAKRHRAASTLQNAFSRYLYKPRTAGRQVKKGTGYVCRHLCDNSARISHIIRSSQTCCLLGQISECLGVLTCGKVENAKREDTGEITCLGEDLLKEDAIEVDSFGVLSYGKAEHSGGKFSGERILGEELHMEDPFDVHAAERIFHDNSLDGEGDMENFPMGRVLHEMGLQDEGGIEIAFPG